MFKRLIVLAVLIVVLAILVKFRKNDDIPAVAEDSSVVVVNNTAYEEGRMAGHYAFLKQTGQYMPMQKSAKYSKDMGDDEEEFNKGYVDGYHRAAESFHCPAGH